MSVKLLDNKAFYGYRVRRTVAGKLYQEYFSLKNGGTRLEGKLKSEVEKQAKARDAGGLARAIKEVRQVAEGVISSTRREAG